MFFEEDDLVFCEVVVLFVLVIFSYALSVRGSSQFAFRDDLPLVRAAPVCFTPLLTRISSLIFISSHLGLTRPNVNPPTPPSTPSQSSTILTNLHSFTLNPQ